MFFGTPEFAVPTLDALLGSPASGRRRRHAAGPAARPRPAVSDAAASRRCAVERGIPVLQPERLQDEGFLEAFAALDADLGVVAAYGKILPDGCSPSRGSA